MSLFRLFNPVTGDHHYTISAAEVVSAVDNSGYNDEGVRGFAVSSSPANCSATAGTVPFFRVFNGQAMDHFYTTSVTERNLAVASLGYSDEGVAACVCP